MRKFEQINLRDKQVCFRNGKKPSLQWQTPSIHALLATFMEHWSFSAHSLPRSWAAMKQNKTKQNKNKWNELQFRFNKLKMNITITDDDNKSVIYLFRKSTSFDRSISFQIYHGNATDKNNYWFLLPYSNRSIYYPDLVCFTPQFLSIASSWLESFKIMKWKSVQSDVHRFIVENTEMAER